jgi:hypothetical protein
VWDSKGEVGRPKVELPDSKVEVGNAKAKDLSPKVQPLGSNIEVEHFKV